MFLPCFKLNDEGERVVSIPSKQGRCSYSQVENEKAEKKDVSIPSKQGRCSYINSIKSLLKPSLNPFKTGKMFLRCAAQALRDLIDVSIPSKQGRCSYKGVYWLNLYFAVSIPSKQGRCSY